ncbi:MAG: hypothetical protein M0R22_00300 [Dehalococcoidia bacterium]|jgi:hypothetical protein|nr:hypothetical protein [Dehalococcoidia bacterium]
MILNGKKKLVTYLTNKTGTTSVKGQVVVQYADLDDAYIAAPAGTILAMGAVLQGGIAGDAKVPICTFGRCQVLFPIGADATRGNWASVHTTDAGMASSEYVALGDIFAQGLGMVHETVASSPSSPILVWIDFVPSKAKDIPVANGGG